MAKIDRFQNEGPSVMLARTVPEKHGECLELGSACTPALLPVFREWRQTRDVDASVPVSFCVYVRVHKPKQDKWFAGRRKTVIRLNAVLIVNDD